MAQPCTLLQPLSEYSFDFWFPSAPFAKQALLSPPSSFVSRPQGVSLAILKQQLQVPGLSSAVPFPERTPLLSFYSQVGVRRWDLPDELGDLWLTVCQHVAFVQKESSEDRKKQERMVNGIGMGGMEVMKDKWAEMGTAVKLSGFLSHEAGSELREPITETTVTVSTELENWSLTIKLRKWKPEKKVEWTSDTVDNEHIGRRSSKCCCIYEKPRAFGESSTESDEVEDEGCGHTHCVRGHHKGRSNASQGLTTTTPPQPPDPSQPPPGTMQH
ncbi:PREDICTED: uncharacterized protein LOC102866503 [Elephantulus edwardii]|uniref:uncharacterized protein LOC102866503 n=1 Tax=Elephantulus edwardii TaxID=28737 RepID=UPI0003F0BF1F|nr:PREDICTED: uncharacterized protein LOC102866503 [Elephantulus edwardii]